jgi:hypothetical protein
MVQAVYGASDGGVPVMTRTTDPTEKRRTTVGRPVPLTDLRILDADLNDAAPGEPGEVVWRSPTKSHGYLNDPARTEEMFWSEGYYRSGDIGVVDSDGYLRIVGRAKDVIIRGGQNISPREIEELIAQHPDVVDVAVIGVPDQVYGERVAACVVPREGCRLGVSDLGQVPRGSAGGQAQAAGARRGLRGVAPECRRQAGQARARGGGRPPGGGAIVARRVETPVNLLQETVMGAEPRIRRIITGERDGKSFFATTEQVAPIVRDNGTKFWGIWGAEDVTRLPNDGSPDYVQTFFPPTGGYRVHFVEFPAAGSPPVEPVGEWPPSGLDTDFQYRDRAAGMHMTDSVDIVIVIEGQIGLESEDGTVVELTPGDVVIQNGAVHAWRYRDAPCRLCFVNLGAVRDKAQDGRST